MSVKTYAVYYPPMSYPVQLGASEGRSPLKWYPLPLSPLSNLKIFCQENHNRRYNFISIISPSQVYHNQKTAPFGFPPETSGMIPVQVCIFSSLHTFGIYRGPPTPSMLDTASVDRREAACTGIHRLCP